MAIRAGQDDLIEPLRAQALGLHRVLEPRGALPQAAYRLDPSPEIAADEVRIGVERLSLDAASYRQLATAHRRDGEAIREEVLEIVRRRGKLHNPVTGSGGMLIGTVEEVGAESPHGLSVGERVASLVSLTLTPLAVSDGLAGWDGHSPQAPARGHAILFATARAARIPSELSDGAAAALFDVCGGPALCARVVTKAVESGLPPVVTVLGGAGRSGSLILAAARREGAARTIAVVEDEDQREALASRGLADAIAVADARDAVATAAAVASCGGPADVSVLCVDAPGCEHAAILATRQGGTVVFFTMAASLQAAALGAEGVGADIWLLVGNGHVTKGPDYALELLHECPELGYFLEPRSGAQHDRVSSGDGRA